MAQTQVCEWTRLLPFSAHTSAEAVLIGGDGGGGGGGGGGA